MADAPPNQECANCRYYWERPDGMVLAPHNNQSIEGFCRFNPPVMVSLSERMGSSPGLVADWWCGQWTPANPEAFSDAAVTLARLVLLGDRTATYALVDKLKEEE